MEKRQCGQSDLWLPALGVGCWAFGGGEYWGNQDQNEVDRTVRRAVELGANYFDTAESYNEGRSELSLGLAMRGLPRDGLIIGTKVNPGSTAPRQLAEHCEASLRRLGTDYIDLYMVHWPIAPHSIAHFGGNGDCPSASAAFQALAKLRRQGKIRWIGVSNFGRTYLEEARCCADVAVDELPYNLLCRAIEEEMLPYCRRGGIGVIGYMALMQGLLSDTRATLDDVPVWKRRTRHFHRRRAGKLCRHGEEGAEEELSAALKGIRKIARGLNMAVPAIAVKWAVATPGITCMLAGARNMAQLEANIQTATEPLDPAIVDLLNAATEPLLHKLGPSFDYYERSDRDRTRPLAELRELEAMKR